jgi:hypothetical protein
LTVSAKDAKKDTQGHLGQSFGGLINDITDYTDKTNIVANATHRPSPPMGEIDTLYQSALMRTQNEEQNEWSERQCADGRSPWRGESKTPKTR